MTRLTFRALAIESLTNLDVSDNKLSRIPTDVGGLAVLESFDVSGNHLRTLPKEMEELEELRVFSCARNRIRWFPGNIYRLESLEEWDLSENLLKELPVTVGDIQLLQSTRVWAVGPGMLQALTKLDVVAPGGTLGVAAARTRLPAAGLQKPSGALAEPARPAGAAQFVKRLPQQLGGHGALSNRPVA